MNTASADRVVRVYFPGWVLEDRNMSPTIGDVIETRLDFITRDIHSTSFDETCRVVAKPVYGTGPGAHADGVLRWPIGLSGDGWSATWWSDQPVSGRIETTGYLCATSGAQWPDSPVPIRGTVRRAHVVAPEDDGDGLAMTGVLVDLDLDDVSPREVDFRAGSVGESGADIWVMDISDPVLLHIDTSRVAPAVTEYLLPMAIESPGDASRFVHADGDGCWISSRHDIFRCDRSADGAIAVERRCIEGGAVVVDRGTVFVLGRTRAAAHLDRRHGVVRVEPATHPVRELDDDGRLIPVEDPATLARVRSAQLAQRARRPAPGQWWSQSGNRLVLTSPDMTSVSLDLSVRERGQVEWVQTDPFDDPRILEVVPMLSADSIREATETT